MTNRTWEKKFAPQIAIFSTLETSLNRLAYIPNSTQFIRRVQLMVVQKRCCCNTPVTDRRLNFIYCKTAVCDLPESCSKETECGFIAICAHVIYQLRDFCSMCADQIQYFLHWHLKFDPSVSYGSLAVRWRNMLGTYHTMILSSACYITTCQFFTVFIAKMSHEPAKPTYIQTKCLVLVHTPLTQDQTCVQYL